ncbi:TetR/AcrR family transcriptional regulator [Vibrio hannami]|nr:TetR/AcrR family transcriptional regulator [Vibrio hannami]MDG3086618.1 TetR/AcrR family transcriptional regulator [Vibrio hannami]
MESKTNAKRQLILNTAKHIILDHDFNALTLDAVAKQAGISKGDCFIISEQGSAYKGAGSICF